MRKPRFLNRQAISVVSALGILLATVAPGLASVVAADQATDQSITMSSSAAGATNVTYEVKFTVSSAGAGAFILDFCDDSPVVNQTCTPPTGFSASGVGTSTDNTTVSAPATSTIKVVKTIAGSEDVDVVLTGITNPSYVTTAAAHGGFYARIATYADSTAAGAYTDADIHSAVDTGGIALATTNTIGVNAAVRETMTFCVANQTITENCGDASTVGHQPNLTLGTGGALDASRVDTGDIYTQLSTNAASGAVVNLKSNATGCGGLKLFGSSACNIVAANGSNLVAGFAGFGVKLNAPFATSGAQNTTGTLQAVDSSGYNDSSYFMGYDSGDDTGVTSAYGDPMLDSNGAPVNNENMKLTFGASINPNTPAGNYSANLNLIASGKY